MLDIPFCFGEYGTQVADSFACKPIIRTPADSMVTCLYRIRMEGSWSVVTVTWSKSLVGVGLSLSFNELNASSSSTTECIFNMKPWLSYGTNDPSSTVTTSTTMAMSMTMATKAEGKPFLFGKKKGSKALELSNGVSLDAYWDLSTAKYGSGAEPLEGFYFVVLYGREIVLLLGNMPLEAYRRTEAKSYSSDTALFSRREHIFGRKIYSTQGQFSENGRSHEIEIECNYKAREPRLSIRVDKQVVLQVKKLLWKFRGNQTILVDGLPVELFWDVHNWLFSPTDGHALFMFQTSVATDKSWSSLASSTSLFHWNQTCSSSSSLKDAENSGFSLLLYASKGE